MTEIMAELTNRSPEQIAAENIRVMFRRFHLNADLMIGLVGDTGSGKSLSAGTIAFSDYLASGNSCWSNMGIKCTVDIPEQLYSGGVEITYEAGRLDRKVLLKMDPRYWFSLIVLDEINIKFAEARRSSSNINLWYSDLNQQKRKFKMPMIYTVVDEMYVDGRVRNLTDVFIRCKDTALSPHGLIMKKHQGIDVEWTVYDMHGKLGGIPFNESNHSLCSMTVNLRDLWGIIDTDETQAKGSRKYTEIDEDEIPNLEITEDPEVVAVKRDWGWLEPIATRILHDGRQYIPVKEIYNASEARDRQVNQKLFTQRLRELFHIESETAYVEGKQQRVYAVYAEALLP